MDGTHPPGSLRSEEQTAELAAIEAIATAYVLAGVEGENDGTPHGAARDAIRRMKALGLRIVMGH